MSAFTTDLSLPEEQPKRPSILIVHREGVGDDVLSMPFLSILAEEIEDHDLYLLAAPGRRELFHGWDRYRVVETCETEKVAELVNLHHEVVFDLAIRPAHITEWIFAPGSLRYGTYVGFAKPKSIPREIAVPVLPHVPIWKQFIGLASALGVRTGCKPDCVIETSDLSKKYTEMLLNLDHDLPLVCVAPGTAGDSLKRWPSEYFAACIRDIHATRPCHVVLLGEQFEKDIGDDIAARVGFEIDNLMGLTPLGCFVHILKQSRLVIANDNGAMHLGGLMNTPTVGLFGPSDPEHYHPLGAKSAVLASVSGDITDIDPASVKEECLYLLESEHP